MVARHSFCREGAVLQNAMDVGFSRILRYCEHTERRAGDTMEWLKEVPVGMRVCVIVRDCGLAHASLAPMQVRTVGQWCG